MIETNESVNRIWSVAGLVVIFVIVGTVVTHLRMPEEFRGGMEVLMGELLVDNQAIKDHCRESYFILGTRINSIQEYIDKDGEYTEYQKSSKKEAVENFF